MKINNNTLYKIFFYLLITIFIVFIVTNTLIEHYDDTNICTAAIKKLTQTKLTDDSQQDDAQQDDAQQDSPVDSMGSCPDPTKNICDVPKGTQPQGDQSQDQSQDKPKPDITVYNTNLYNNRQYLNNIGQKMVNYIDADDYTSFQQNYPSAYKSFIKARQQNPNLGTFVYVPM